MNTKYQLHKPWALNIPLRAGLLVNVNKPIWSGNHRKGFRQVGSEEVWGIISRDSYGPGQIDWVTGEMRTGQHTFTIRDRDLQPHLIKGRHAYPHLRFNEVVFHQDHIHPAAGFTEEKFKEIGLTETKWQDWWNCRDCVPNLQLMEGRQNESKNASPLKGWIEQMRETEQAAFASNNYFPEGVGLDFKDFMSFYQKRQEILRCH